MKLSTVPHFYQDWMIQEKYSSKLSFLSLRIPESILNQLYVVFEFECYLDLTQYSVSEFNSDYEFLAEKIRQIFADAEVEVFDVYHQSKKSPERWTIEPDQSLISTYFTDVGKPLTPVEIVTPWLRFSEIDRVLNGIKTLFQQHNGITDPTTSCHVNIRIENERLDWLKLLMMFDEGNELMNFNRAERCFNKLKTNRYSKQVKPFVVHLLKSPNNSTNTITMSDIQNCLYGHFIEEYSIWNAKHHTITLEKFFRDWYGCEQGFVEFRTIGGDYLNATFPKLKKTIHKYVTLFVCCLESHSYYNQEYQTHIGRLLYKTIHSRGNMEHVVDMSSLVGLLKTIYIYEPFTDKVIECLQVAARQIHQKNIKETHKKRWIFLIDSILKRKLSERVAQLWRSAVSLTK